MMKKFKNHQRPRRKYRFNIVGHKKALKIWWDSPFNMGIYIKHHVCTWWIQTYVDRNVLLFRQPHILVSFRKNNNAICVFSSILHDNPLISAG